MFLNSEKGKKIIKQCTQFGSVTAGIGFASLSIDAKVEEMLRKDEEYRKEREELNKKIDKEIMNLKTKYIEKYIEEGKL